MVNQVKEILLFGVFEVYAGACQHTVESVSLATSHTHTETLSLGHYSPWLPAHSH